MSKMKTCCVCGNEYMPFAILGPYESQVEGHNDMCKECLTIMAEEKYQEDKKHFTVGYTDDDGNDYYDDDNDSEDKDDYDFQARLEKNYKLTSEDEEDYC